MNQALRFAWALAVLLCLSSGCTSTMTVEANGSRKTDQPLPPHVTFAVFPTTEVEKDLAFPAYARLVARKLTEQDYKETEPTVAKLGVYLAYGVREQAADVQTSVAQSPSSYTSGSGGTGGYGTTASSAPAAGFRRYVSQVVVVVADLPQSRAAGSVVELWRGQAQTAGPIKDLSALAPLLIEAAFRHFGDETPHTVRHTFSEEEISKLRESP
ncbi:DUF4136 domain-containing protein [Nitrospira moscoviensis]|uniref:DUF4136 domain-containing protein n=1 Tax=Nitrospira moscoviensis TaxID=42253 RepID=A0A0K2G8P2_NITMO|nr:DUF4136 domain-containing protein [Nitrospira moscoviensis]ALA57328.1 exported protein of unknown function [Nitrospira moscoviensis]